LFLSLDAAPRRRPSTPTVARSNGLMIVDKGLRMLGVDFR
jgi:hypothetical protein